MHLLKLVAIPRIITVLITGVTGLGRAERLGKMFGRTLLYYVGTSMLAIVTGLAVVNLVRPGVHVPVEAPQAAADKIATEFGVDKDVLVACDSPEAMRTTAKALAYDKAQETKAEEDQKPQKVDSGVQNIPGVDLEGMTPQQLIKWGLEHPKNK